MTTKQLEAKVSHRDGMGIIDLDGEINAVADDALNDAYVKATADKTSAILLNFINVSYINSTGIALIVGVLIQARNAGIRVLTTGLSDHYTEIFKITRLADFMTIVPDEERAVAAVAKGG